MTNEKRRSGRTTRLADHYIQLLFTWGEVEVEDHTTMRESNEHLLNIISRRLSLEHPCMKFIISSENERIIKLCHKKDFLWYAKEYLSQKTLGRYLENGLDNVLLNQLRNENYIEIPQEFRIGLLKFICEYINVSQFMLFSFLAEISHKDSMGVSFGRLEDVCPKGFLKSLTT